MKRIIFLLFGLYTLIGFSQERVIEIDYTVDYLIPNNKKQTNDTITIGFNKDGEYLWTNDDILTKQFSEGNFLKNATNFEDSEMNLIYSANDNRFLFTLEFMNSYISADIDIAQIAPINPNDGFNEDINLITTPLNNKEKVLSYDCSTFELYPDSEPEEIISVFIDENQVCKNNVYFSKFVDLILRMTSSKGNVKVNVPNGLILKVNDSDGSTLIEAIKVDDTKKTITLNYSFKIKG